MFVAKELFPGSGGPFWFRLGRVRRNALLKTACVVLASVSLNAGAQNAAPAALWYEAGHVALTVMDASRELAAAWQFDRADNGDVRIVKEERRGAARVHGTLLSICGDQALLFKDIVPAGLAELQELNEPVLHLQLALRLLARALPQGPQVFGEQMSIDTGDDQQKLQVRKGPRARLEFGPPWRVRGSVTRGEAGDIRFDMDFEYGNSEDKKKNGRAGLKLAGLWRQQSGVRALDDAFALTGWRVHRIDTVAQVTGGNTLLDIVAMPRPLQFATLGELRSRIERRWDSGPRAQRHFECSR